MFKLGHKNAIKTRRSPDVGWDLHCLRAVVVLLVALFAVAALHELIFVVLGHESGHHHETCPLCHFIHTPVLISLCVVLVARFFTGRVVLPQLGDAPATQWIALPPASRAPPLA